MPAVNGDPIYDSMVAARVGLLFDMPWLGTLALRLKLVEADGWCKTAATDGRHFFYNREFIKGLTSGGIKFLAGHEILHVVYDHLSRRGGRNPKLLNMAQDFVINYALKSCNVGTMPIGGLYDERFTDEMTSEDVYKILERESTTVRDTLDEHLDLFGGGENGEGDGGAAGGQDYEVTVLGKDGPPKLTEEDLRQIREDMKTALIQASRTHGADKMPKGMKRMISDLIEPKMDWRALLDAHIRSTIRGNFTFSRPARKSQALRFLLSVDPVEGEEDPFETLRERGAPILPAQDVEDAIDLFVAIDCSGSETVEMIRDQLSETKGIMQTFGDFTIRVITFDHAIHNFRLYRPENVNDIDSYPIVGGGGTDFPLIFRFLKDNAIEPHRLVVFTDGLPNNNDWGDPNYVDTLFVIHSNKKIKAPFGMTAYYEPNEKARFEQRRAA